jgi:hypothetical protein
MFQQPDHNVVFDCLLPFIDSYEFRPNELSNTNGSLLSIRRHAARFMGTLQSKPVIKSDDGIRMSTLANQDDLAVSILYFCNAYSKARNNRFYLAEASWGLVCCMLRYFDYVQQFSGVQQLKPVFNNPFSKQKLSPEMKMIWSALSTGCDTAIWDCAKQLALMLVPSLHAMSGICRDCLEINSTSCVHTYIFDVYATE